MARLPNTATKQERREVHAYKMAGKVIDRKRMQAPEPLHRNHGVTSIARSNRHTGETHQNKRAVARFLRQQGLNDLTASKSAPGLGDALGIAA